MTVASALRHPSPSPLGGVEVRMCGLTVGVLVSNGTALVRLQGSLDAASSPLLAAAGRSLIRSGTSRILLDCGHLDFCDSAGIHAFALLRDLPEVTSVALVRTSRTIRRLVEIAGLEMCFDVVPGTPARELSGVAAG